MLKTVALIGAGIAIGCCYQSCKKNPQKSKNANLDKCGKQSKDCEVPAKE
ncbi:hypothetical protein [Acinetobacter sp. ANC 3813]|nr:hypothetical protein [Acinetobacter sp. ANC 3813]